MTDWLARLQSLKTSPNTQRDEPTNLPKKAFVSFGSALPGERAKISPTAGCRPESAPRAFVSFGSSVSHVDANFSPRSWDASDWREYFDERLAIAESRRIAWESCIARWRDLNPASSDPSRCAWCGEPDEPGNIVPFGIDPYAWLHDRCWPDWDRARQAEAEAALRLLIGENIDDQ